jgi:hypothetical protein
MLPFSITQISEIRSIQANNTNTEKGMGKRPPLHHQKTSWQVLKIEAPTMGQKPGDTQANYRSSTTQMTSNKYCPTNTTSYRYQMGSQPSNHQDPCWGCYHLGSFSPLLPHCQSASALIFSASSSAYKPAQYCRKEKTVNISTNRRF